MYTFEILHEELANGWYFVILDKRGQKVDDIPSDPEQDFETYEQAEDFIRDFLK